MSLCNIFLQSDQCSITSFSCQLQARVRTSKNIKSNTTLHNQLHVAGDGFGSQVQCFLLLALPIVGSALLGVVFCLDLGPFFSLLLFGCWVFFLIYLFIMPLHCTNLTQDVHKSEMKAISGTREEGSSLTLVADIYPSHLWFL